MMLKVLVYEPAGRGGMKIYSDGFAKGLASIGVEVEILTNREAEYESSEYKVINRLRDPGRTVSRLVWAADRLITSMYNSILLIKMCNADYDICHLQQISPVLDWMLLKLIRIPYVITVHDVKPHEKRWWERRWQWKKIYKGASSIIVHSMNNRDTFLGIYHLDQSMIHIIRHGFEKLDGPAYSKEHARKLLGLPLDKLQCMMIGAIRSDKGLDVAIRALAYVEDWNLVVAGHGKKVSAFKELAEKYNVDNRVHWRIGFISDAEMSLFFQAADVVLLPYKPDFESQSGVLFQAYRYHIPVVGTDVGGIGETIKNDGTGVVVPPESPKEIAEALYPAASMKEKIDWAAIEEKYSWANVAKDTLKVYRKAKMNNERNIHNWAIKYIVNRKNSD